MADEPTINGLSVSGLQDWLKQNPTHPLAAKVRAALQGAGYHVPSAPPTTTMGWAGDVAQAVGQGFFLDLPEKIGQAAQHLPGRLGTTAREMAADPVPSWLQGTSDYLQSSREAGERHPVARTVGNVLPWMLVPGAGESVAANALIGGAAGLSQPLDPNDPNYARDLAYQGTMGAVTSGILGPIAGRAARVGAEQKAQQAIAAMQKEIESRFSTYNKGTVTPGMRVRPGVLQLNQARLERFAREKGARGQENYEQRLGDYETRMLQRGVPQQTTLQWWKEALTPTGDQGLAPTTIGPETTAMVRSIVQQRMNAALNQMGFQADHMFGTTLRDSTSRMLSAANVQDWNDTFNELITQPILKTNGSMNGQQFSRYVMDIGARLQQMSQQIRAESMPRVKADLITQRNQLQSVFDAIMDRASGTPEVKLQLQNARRGYNLWSIGNGATAAERGGMIEPDNLAREWAGRQGDARYGEEMLPGHENYHPENARLKHWIEAQRQQHQTGPEPQPPQEPQTPPGKWGEQTPPTLYTPPTPPTPKTAGPGASVLRKLWHMPGAIAGFKLGSEVGHPFAGAGTGIALQDLLAESANRAVVPLGRRPGGPAATAAHFPQQAASAMNAGMDMSKLLLGIPGAQAATLPDITQPSAATRSGGDQTADFVVDVTAPRNR